MPCLRQMWLTLGGIGHSRSIQRLSLSHRTMVFRHSRLSGLVGSWIISRCQRIDSSRSSRCCFNRWMMSFASWMRLINRSNSFRSFWFSSSESSVVSDNCEPSARSLANSDVFRGAFTPKTAVANRCVGANGAESDTLVSAGRVSVVADPSPAGAIRGGLRCG